MTDQMPLVVVDAANVVGSVPDGWWWDRLGAARRLRDALVRDAAEGLAATGSVPDWAETGPLDVVLVVEGKARGLTGVPGVDVVGTSGSGDDEIVRLVAAARDADPGRRCAVVTADRELRARVTALGAVPVGPRAVRRS
ncbi:NTP pyrophosphohydrolase [Streptodolium elevatio]